MRPGRSTPSRAPAWRETAGRSLHPRPWSSRPRAQAAEAPFAPAVLVDGGPEGGVVEIRPEIGKEDEFRIGRLPGQEIRDPLLARGADDEIGIGHVPGVEGGPKGLHVDGRWIETPLLHLLGE